jgi:hypothetical protein
MQTWEDVRVAIWAKARTDVAVGKALNIHINTARAWRTGRGLPLPRQEAKIAEYLDVSREKIANIVNVERLARHAQRLLAPPAPPAPPQRTINAISLVEQLLRRGRVRHRGTSRQARDDAQRQYRGRAHYVTL